MFFFCLARSRQRFQHETKPQHLIRVGCCDLPPPWLVVENSSSLKVETVWAKKTNN